MSLGQAWGGVPCCALAQLPTSEVCCTIATDSKNSIPPHVVGVKGISVGGNERAQHHTGAVSQAAPMGGTAPPPGPTASLPAALHPANCPQELGIGLDRSGAHKTVAVISALAHTLQAGAGTALFAPASLPGGVDGDACTAATGAQVGSGGRTSTNSGDGPTVSAPAQGTASPPPRQGVGLLQAVPGGTDGGGPAASRLFARKGGGERVGSDGMGSHSAGSGGGGSTDGRAKISTDEGGFPPQQACSHPVESAADPWPCEARDVPVAAPGQPFIVIGAGGAVPVDASTALLKMAPPEVGGAASVQEMEQVAARTLLRRLCETGVLTIEGNVWSCPVESSAVVEGACRAAGVLLIVCPATSDESPPLNRSYLGRAAALGGTKRKPRGAMGGGRGTGSSAPARGGRGGSTAPGGTGGGGGRQDPPPATDPLCIITFRLEVVIKGEEAQAAFAKEIYDYIHSLGAKKPRTAMSTNPRSRITLDAITRSGRIDYGDDRQQECLDAFKAIRDRGGGSIKVWGTHCPAGLGPKRRRAPGWAHRAGWKRVKCPPRLGLLRLGGKLHQLVEHSPLHLSNPCKQTRRGW